MFFKIKSMRAQWPLYVMVLPAAILAFIYSYLPMVGTVIAFKNFSVARGIFGSKWVGLDNFVYIFHLPNFFNVLWNTFFISGMKMIVGISFPIIVCILLNEVYKVTFKRSIQTLIYLPHFISWVIIGGLMIDILSPTTGIVNQLLRQLGLHSINFLGDVKIFPFVLVISDLWKEFGWGTIIFFAAITNIDLGQYEAAEIDGASRFQKMWHITIPGIMPTIVLVAILRLGQVLNAGFEQVFILYNPLVYESGDILDTLVYRIGMVQTQYDVATAIGLFKSAVSTFFVSISYYIAYKVANYRIF